MSCNGCRILRKGCNENCILRQSLTSIETPQAQASATVFVAKFFGRACLMSFLSSVPEHQRPDLFQSLLFEACGRTINPINGAVGLVWTGNWHLCQSAVATVLQGGTIRAMSSDLFAVGAITDSNDINASVEAVNSNSNDHVTRSSIPEDNLELALTRSGFNTSSTRYAFNDGWTEKVRTTSSSDVSETMTFESSTPSTCSETKLLRLFL